jgi:hypothetical protein
VRALLRALLRLGGFSLAGTPVARLLLLVAGHVLPKRLRAFPRAGAGKRHLAGGVWRDVLGVHAAL